AGGARGRGSGEGRESRRAGGALARGKPLRKRAAQATGGCAQVKGLVLALLLAAGLAHAHKPSDSYLTLHADGKSLRGQWDIALRDLEYAVGLDADGDGAITWGELKAKQNDADAYALARLALEADGRPCKLSPTGHL